MLEQLDRLANITLATAVKEEVRAVAVMAILLAFPTTSLLKSNHSHDTVGQHKQVIGLTNAYYIANAYCNKVQKMKKIAHCVQVAFWCLLR
jgi:hypothetical protein